MLPPEPYRTIQFETFWRDRRWFEEHPGESAYRRDYVPGEFWPHDADLERDSIEYVTIAMADFLGAERGRLREWAVHPPVLFGGGDAEDAVNWKVRARTEGLPADGPCSRCGASAAATFFDEPWQGSSFWLRCPECRALSRNED
jgi:hypothetical protein